MNVKSMYGTKLRELLEKYLAKNEPLAENGLFMFENLEENTLLFIGINPSEVEDIESKYRIKNENGIYWGNETFKNNYPYYQHFDKLAHGMKWSHLDLYFSLKTKQNNIMQMEGNEFLKEQFNISKEIIQKLAPRIIVVGNAYASRLIKENFECIFDDIIGTCRIKEYNNVPIFFSGMFTGQRALDTGSRERLKWHIGFLKTGGNPCLNSAQAAMRLT